SPELRNRTRAGRERPGARPRASRARAGRERVGAEGRPNTAGCGGSLAGSSVATEARGLESEAMAQALLVIDVQDSFRGTERWQSISDPAVIDRIAALVERFRTAGASVIWILHSEPGSDSAFDPASGLVRVVDALEPAADEPVIVKTTINS